MTNPRAAGIKYDVVIIGGGHNGLVCAAYLAAAGRSVCVLERRRVVGGAAVTEEFAPGFRNSTASYTVSLLHPRIIRDLRLFEHGLRIVERPFANFLPLPNGASFRLGGGTAATQAEIARFDKRDAERLPAYYAMLERAVQVLRDLNLRAPPAVGQSARAGDWLAGLQAALSVRRVPDSVRRDLLDLFTRSAGDLLDGWFKCDPLKAAFGWDSIVGNFASPYTPGSAYVLLHHVFGEVNGKIGVWGHAIGGMGSITQAMARECEARGVALMTEAEVVRVVVDDDAPPSSGGAQRDPPSTTQRSARNVARAVELIDGRVIEGRAIVANVGPRLLFERLIDPSSIDADFMARMRQFKTGSASFRLNVALSELPDFACAPGTHAQPHHGAGILFASDLRAMEGAYFDARSREHTPGWSREPIVELNIASTLDDTLAPRGAHVASIFCQHFDPSLREAWDRYKPTVVDTIVDLIDRHAPNFRRSIVGLQAYSPMDLERLLGLIDGDIFHGALQLNQLWAARPVLGHGNYRMPMRGLYLCGSGAHPGGGVTGVPGRNAAREIDKDFKRGRIAR